jgi:hypothetical protein
MLLFVIVFRAPRRLRSNRGKIDCRTIVYLAKRPKRFFPVWPQDSIVLQLYILLIYKKLFLSAGKADVFGLDVSVGLWVDLCGLHSARKRSKGVWGLWKIAPN